MKKLTLNLIALALLAGNAAAFDLSGLGAADLRAAQGDFRAPAPQSQPADDLIGVDVNIRIPYATVKKGVEMVAASETRLTIIDSNAPVAFKSGEFMRITNIRIDQGGIIVTPTLTLRPYLAGTDRFAIRVQRVQLHASMEPSVKAAALPAINEEEIMAQVMDVIIKGIRSSVNEFLKKKQLPVTAENVVRLNYDKAAWTLYGAVSSREIHNLINSNLMGELHLTGFSFNDRGLVLTIQTAQ
jgi:hypothetical protein